MASERAHELAAAYALGALDPAERRLAPFAPAHREVDVESLLAQVHAAAETVAEGSLDLRPPAL